MEPSWKDEERPCQEQLAEEFGKGDTGCGTHLVGAREKGPELVAMEENH